MKKAMTHGFMSFTVEGSILVIKGQGPWNLDAINESVVETKKDIAKLYGKPWGVLVIAFGDSILVPDAVEELSKIIRSDREKGRLATALVIQECSIPQLVESHLSQIYLCAGDAFGSFAEESEARAWLNQQLCNLEPKKSSI